MVQYVAARLLIASPATDRVMLHTSNQHTQSHHTYVRMVLRQNTSPQLKRLLLHHQSILMPSNGKVRGGKIVHCTACNRPSHIAQSYTHTKTHKHTNTHTHTHTHTKTHMHIYVCTYMHTYYTNIHTCIQREQALYIHVNICTYILKCVHARK